MLFDCPIKRRFRTGPSGYATMVEKVVGGAYGGSAWIRILNKIMFHIGHASWAII